MGKDTENFHRPQLDCHQCDFSGKNYNVKQSGPHIEARCPKCDGYIKYLSHKDKYGTKDQQRRIWDKTKGRCCYCGEKVNPFIKNGYTYEHVDPQANGGGNGQENLMPCCKSCNSQKKDKTLGDYRRWLAKKRGSKTPCFLLRGIGV